MRFSSLNLKCNRRPTFVSRASRYWIPHHDTVSSTGKFPDKISRNKLVLSWDPCSFVVAVVRFFSCHVLVSYNFLLFYSASILKDDFLFFHCIIFPCFCFPSFCFLACFSILWYLHCEWNANDSALSSGALEVEARN